jgi:NADPH-dependent F420 reductase
VDVGIVGATGPLGSALAARLASVGVSVGVGSREVTRAKGVVTRLEADWPEVRGRLAAVENEQAARAAIVVLAVPWEALARTVDPLVHTLEGKVVVSLGNALMRVGEEFQPVTVPRGSVTAMVQSLLPQSLVVGALHHVPARALANLARPVGADTLVVSDHASASHTVHALLERVPGLRVLVVGSLALAPAVESMTAALLNLNLRYRGQASLTVTGLEGSH